MKPFWGWNDRLNKEELENQIKEIKKAGNNGFFMHARGGLLTEYMSDEWFDMIETCLNCADELGMQAWAYDENGWPSGFGNGKVPSASENYCQKWLECEVIENITALPENVIAFYRIKDNKANRIDIPKEGDTVIYCGINRYYIDTFNEDAVHCFITETHEKYYNRFSKRFGKSLKGFFTDEPQFGNNFRPPWSHLFKDEFLKRYGYDITDRLILLFYNAEGYEKFRCNFYNMVSSLFKSSFIKQMYNWCTSHNCMLTGHMMNEDSILSQMSSSAGVMPCYEYFHIPGIDWLGRKIGSPITPKQLGSVAAQLEKDTMTETFALCGWDVSLNELKQIAQWQFVNGVTSICTHISSYSLRGNRKRDYPPSFFTQLPWFESAYGVFTSYFTKLGELLKSGTEYAPLLVIHPLQSAYIAYNPLDINRLKKISDSFDSTAQLLSSKHIPHHYGDESIIKKYALVKGNVFSVGKCDYKAVLLPELLNICESTLIFLLDFAKHGGIVYYTGNFPKYVDGSENDNLKLLCSISKRLDCHSLPEELSSISAVSIKTDNRQNGNILCSTTEMPDGTVLHYLVNLSEYKQETEIELPESFCLSEYDLLNEKEIYINSQRKNGHTFTALSFDAFESHIIKCGAGNSQIKSQSKEYIALDSFFEITHCSDNCLTLDKCEYRIDNGEWQREKAVILIQDELLANRQPCDIELKFTFEIASKAIINNLKLCIETPDKYSIEINGKPFTFKDTGCFIDSSIRKAPLKEITRHGKNEIIMKTRFYQNDDVYRVLFSENVHESELNKLTYNTELESIYITGCFGVACNTTPSIGERKTVFSGKNFTITGSEKHIDINNITVQGYYFFAGKMDLTQNIRIEKAADTSYFIKLINLYSPAAELYINGKKAGIFSFAPFEIDVTGFLRNGTNRITIRLLSGNRNLFGPHHRPYGESHFVGPDTFKDKPGWTDIGKEAWTDNYSFVLFGAEI